MKKIRIDVLALCIGITLIEFIFLLTSVIL